MVDAGASVQLFNAQGNFAALGRVTFSGWVQGVGMMKTGQASGDLTLHNSKGTLTVTLQGPQQAGFSPLPETFHYQITGGTGAYQNLSDQGTLKLVFLQPHAGSIPGQDHGRFVVIV
jgi:hypothetical protein